MRQIAFFHYLHNWVGLTSPYIYSRKMLFFSENMSKYTSHDDYQYINHPGRSGLNGK